MMSEDEISMFSITTFDDAIEYILDLIGSEFEKAINLTNKILENPSDYTGPQAAMSAIKMAGYRMKIGVAAQLWKQRSTNTKKPQDRLIKDALMVMYDGLSEVINTLKLVARHEHELTR
jgi:hypothetical protein